eukprot:SAG31_NODE_3_length_45830_cov_42.279701_22_plen_113_part_00
MLDKHQFPPVVPPESEITGVLVFCRAFIVNYTRLLENPDNPKEHISESWVCTDLRGLIPPKLVNDGFVRAMDGTVKKYLKLVVSLALCILRAESGLSLDMALKTLMCFVCLG